jgi:ubiquinone/menaquinone biosynthesis C-methylase UbiE
MWSETLGHSDYRPPYLPQFFSDVAREIPLSGREDLLDLGCGAGEVALGFARYVRSLTGLDAELPMIAAARERARQQGAAIRLVHSKAEEAPEELGSFHLVTIGQAHWFMHSPATRARIERWVQPDGSLLICRPLADAAGATAWYAQFRAIRRRWARGDFAAKMRLTSDEFLAGADFELSKQIVTHGRRSVELEHLVHRALGTPDTSRAMLGADTERMIAEIRAEMAPFFKGGPLPEELRTIGLLYRRRRSRPPDASAGALD